MFQAECAAMCHEGGRLTRVRYGTHAELAAPSAIVLDFEGGSWALTVNEDDDTVEIAEAKHGLPEELRFHAPPAGSPWAGALGTSAQWIRVLRNQQGCDDGVQFCFASGGREMCRIQLTAAASTWHVGQVARAV